MDSHPQAKKNCRSRHIDWFNLVIGALFALAALFSMFNPLSDLGFFAIIFIAAALTRGFWRITQLNRFALLVLCGILDIVFGVLTLVNLWANLMALPHLFGVWFILDSLIRLITAGFTNAPRKSYSVFSTLIDIMGISLGILLLVNPVSAAMLLSYLLAVYMLLISIECFMYAL